MSDKIASLIGFAIKADKIIYGLDELSHSKHKRYLIIRCNTLSQGAKEETLFVAERDKVPLIEVKNGTLADLVHKRNCKVIGIKNKQMADAMMQYITNDYSIIRSEERN